MLAFDQRRNLFIGKTEEEAIDYAAENWVHTAQRAIQQKGRFCVALSGGSTPKAIYQRLENVKDVDWTKVFLFWSDERAVPPESPESNFGSAMQHFKKLPIPPSQIFRMIAERDIEKNAKDYEEKIHHYVGKHLFDLVMLGIGEDGHTASLFPGTEALHIEDRLISANYVKEKKSNRMTFTFPCINQSEKIALYAIGKSKADIVPKVLKAPIISKYPASRIGTAEKPALWVLDAFSSSSM